MAEGRGMKHFSKFVGVRFFIFFGGGGGGAFWGYESLGEFFQIPSTSHTAHILSAF